MECIDIKLICRLCAREDKFCIEVFGEDGLKNNISKKIRLCLPIAIKEDDEFPKQICLCCLNKLDTSYELYSGCMNAQNTIKRLLKNCTQSESAKDNLPVEIPVEQVQNVTDVMAQQQPTLSRSAPFMKFGNTVIKLQDIPSKKRSNERVSERRLKVRRSECERHDDLNLELVIDDDSNGIDSPLPSLSLDDDESTQTPQQVSQMGPLTEDLSPYNVEPSNQMYVAGNVGRTASEHEQFGTSGILSEASSVGQCVGNIPTSTGAKILGTVPTISSVGTQALSATSSGMAVTLNELSGTSSQYVISSPVDSIVPVIIQQPMRSTVRQPQVYIPNSVYSLAVGKQDGLIADSLNSVNQLEGQASLLLQKLVEDKLQEMKHVHLQKQTPQHQSGQHEQTKWHQQYSSPENGEITLCALAPVTRSKTEDKILKSGLRPMVPTDNAQQKGPPNVLIATSSNVVSSQQQKTFSWNLSSGLVGKIRTETASVLQQLPVEARQIAHVSPTVQANNCQVYVSDSIQNSSSVGVDQQVVDLESEHLSSSGYPVQAQGVVSADDTVTATTNAVIATMTGAAVARIPTTGCEISLRAPTTLSMVTPTAASLMGVGLHAPPPAVTTSGTSIGVPAISEIGIITPVSSYTLNLLTTTVSSSPISVVAPTTTSAFNTVTSTASSANNTPVSDSMSAVRTGISSTLLTIKEDIPDEPLKIEEPSRDTNVTTVSPPTPTPTVATSNNTADNVTEENTRNLCQYCNQTFPENIIVHHRKLHFRQRFFTCIVCGKNFRTEVGLENHRCAVSAD